MRSPRDQISALIEDCSQRDLRQIAEFCVDHINDVKEVAFLADYLRLHRDLEADQYREAFKSKRRIAKA